MKEEQFCKHINIEETVNGRVCKVCGMRELTEEEIEEIYNNGKPLINNLKQEKKE